MDDADFDRDLNEQQEPEVFDIIRELESSYIDPTIDIPEPPIILAIDDKPVFTAGNISTIIGKAKSKKTFFLVGTLSAIASGTWGKVTGRRTEKSILWFDTEMSTYHATRMVRRCMDLTGGKGNILAYGLRPYTPAQRMELIEHAIYSTPNLGFCAIDGLRDLLTNGINDEAEATTVTSKFMKWTSELDIHITLILHQNKNDLNARGHIGSEAMNKSETVISVSKFDKMPSVSEVKADFSRNEDFEPFAFTISDSGLPEFTEMQVSSRGRLNTEPAKVSDVLHFEILNKIFRAEPIMKYGEFKNSIKVLFSEKGISFGENRAKEYVTYYLFKEWILKKEKGKYEYNRSIF